AEKLSPTTFTYQSAQYANSFVTQLQPVPDHQDVRPDWTAIVAPDFDGDGFPEHLYSLISSLYGRAQYLETSCGGFQSFQLGTNWTGFDVNGQETQLHAPMPLEFSADFDNDGRAKLIGLDVANNLAFGTLRTCGSATITVTSTNLPLTFGPNYAAPIDIDGDGILDLRYGTSV